MGFSVAAAFESPMILQVISPVTDSNKLIVTKLDFGNIVILVLSSVLEIGRTDIFTCLSKKSVTHNVVEAWSPLVIISVRNAPQGVCRNTCCLVGGINWHGYRTFGS